MHYSLRRFIGAAGMAVALAAVGACRQQDAEQPPAASNANTAPAANQPPGSVNAALRAAAEPFEVLTESAFGGDWSKIEGMIAAAQAAAADLRQDLPASNAARLSKQLATIVDAKASKDQVGLALAAVEGYRILVESQDPASAAPPVAVSLLDYAGFRYNALAQAPTVDWQKMAGTMTFALEQWSKLAPMIESAATPGVIDAALASMTRAVDRQDVAAARSAAAIELALVDLLEEQVAQKSPC